MIPYLHDCLAALPRLDPVCATEQQANCKIGGTLTRLFDVFDSQKNRSFENQYIFRLDGIEIPYIALHQLRFSRKLLI